MAMRRASLVKLLPAAWSGAGLIFVALVVLQPTTAIYLLIAGLPTAAIFMIDDDAEQRGIFSVGALNLAGAMPFVLLGVVLALNLLVALLRRWRVRSEAAGVALSRGLAL